MNEDFITSGSASPARPIKNHLALSIISTLLCCLPLGIVSIVYAAKVDSLVYAGNLQAAAHASKKAKFWGWLSVWIGLAWTAFWIIFVAVANAMALNTTSTY